MRAHEWYELPDHAVVRVVEVGGSPEMVLAEGANGGVLERPAANARIRWRRLPEDGLAVRQATAADAVRQLVDDDPVAVVILAIKDLGGNATTKEIKRRLRPIIGADELAPWWKRNQPKLSKDSRINNVDALSKRYSLVARGRAKPERVRDVRSASTLAGKHRLDTPTLKSSREKAKRPRNVDEPPRTALMEVARLVDDAAIDSTDRFLAGEIGVFLEEWTESQLGDKLRAGATELDLLRVPDHKSRDRALRLAERSIENLTPPEVLWSTLASAVAVGEPWSDGALDLADAAGYPRRSSLAAGLLWAAPGRPEGGAVDHPKDLQAYLARLRRLGNALAAADNAGVDRQSHNVLMAMDALSSTSQKGQLWLDCVTGLAEVLWDVPAATVPLVLESIKSRPPQGGDSWRAIVDEAPNAELVRLEQLLEAAMIHSPATLSALESYARRVDRDLSAWLVQIARKEIRASGVSRVVVRAIDQSPRTSTTRSESVTLGGTIWPEHSVIASRLNMMEQEARESLLSGMPTIPGPVLLRQAAWPRLVADIHHRIVEAQSQRDEAVQARTELEARLAAQAERLDDRRAALHAAKSTQTQQGTASTQRLAANLFKPIAVALDDSYEAGSLTAMQDQVRAAMGRLHIRPMVAPGDVFEFDPDRHTWTGDGYPPTRVQAITPGFIARLEEGEELVLTFARVGPAPD